MKLKYVLVTNVADQYMKYPSLRLRLTSLSEHLSLLYNDMFLCETYNKGFPLNRDMI